MFQYLFCLHILRIDHQTARVAIEPVDHMSRALLTRLLEIVVEHRLHVQARVTRSHREDAYSLLYHDEPLVFIHDLHITALESLLVTLGTAHGNLHAALQGKVELAHGLAIDLDTPTLQCRLDFRTTLLHVCQQPFQQRLGLFDGVMVVVALLIIS